MIRSLTDKEIAITIRGLVKAYSNLAHVYELINSNKTDDLPFILECAEVTGSPILDVGCGTARVSLVLAQAGYKVVGIDFSAKMLGIASKKIQEQSPEVRRRITLIHQDMRDLHIGGQHFALALMPFGEFSHLITREHQEEYLRRCSRHLTPNALLVIGMSNRPLHEEHISYRDVITNYEEMPNPEYVGDFFDSQNAIKIIRYVSRGYDPYLDMSVRLFMDEIYDREGNIVTHHVNIVPIFYVSIDELSLMLETTGFRINKVYGHFDKRNFTPESKYMILVAKKI